MTNLAELPWCPFSVTDRRREVLVGSAKVPVGSTLFDADLSRPPQPKRYSPIGFRTGY